MNHSEKNKRNQNQNEENCNTPDLNFCDLGPLTPLQRRDEAYTYRDNTAIKNKDLALSSHPCNHDEEIYPNKIGNFSKSLHHNELGEVCPEGYNKLIKALSTGNPDYFEDIPLGGTVKLVNPQASYAYDLMAPDCHHATMPPAPSFSSDEAAGEMVEVYWQSLTRDIPFLEYDKNCLIQEAAKELSSLNDFRGPKQDGKVTPQTIFRGNTPEELKGPYISQFLYLDLPYGTNTYPQKNRTPVSGEDFMTTYSEWLDIQNGASPKRSQSFDKETKYIRNGRDLAQFVHMDFPFQSVLDAGLILLGFGVDALDTNNPYINSKTQDGFVTFGAPHILDFTTKAVRLALEAAWFQKWCVHRRLRPEAFGGCVQNAKTGAANYPISPSLLNSKAVEKTHRKYGTYLLSQAYPEGSPSHPSYPAGHATFVGAGVTILKAFFNENYTIPQPVEASLDGLTLNPYKGSKLSILGELNKLASNVAIGRDWAGIHYRSDATDGLKLGESVAIGILEDYCQSYNENVQGFTLTKFDGTQIIIGC